MTTATKLNARLEVRLMHNASIPGARWCEPIGWEPSNVIEGAEMQDGTWWDDDNEVAGLVWFGDVNAYGTQEIIVTDIDDLRVASCGDCRVIGEVALDAKARGWIAGKAGQPKNDNPFPVSIAAHRMWADSWELAQRD